MKVINISVRSHIRNLTNLKLKFRRRYKDKQVVCKVYFYKVRLTGKQLEESRDFFMMSSFEYKYDSTTQTMVKKQTFASLHENDNIISDLQKKLDESQHPIRTTINNLKSGLLYKIGRLKRRYTDIDLNSILYGDPEIIARRKKALETDKAKIIHWDAIQAANEKRYKAFEVENERKKLEWEKEQAVNKILNRILNRSLFDK